MKNTTNRGLRALFGVPQSEWTHFAQVLQESIRLFLKDSGIFPDDAHKARMIDFMWENAMGTIDRAALKVFIETMPQEDQRQWRAPLTLWGDVWRDGIRDVAQDLSAAQRGSGGRFFDPDAGATQVDYILSKFVIAYAQLRSAAQPPSAPVISEPLRAGAPMTPANAWAREQFEQGRTKREILAEYTERYGNEPATPPDKALRDLFGRWQKGQRAKKG